MQQNLRPRTLAVVVALTLAAGVGTAALVAAADGGDNRPIPVEPDGGIGDTPMPVEPDGGIGDTPVLVSTDE